MIEFTIKTLDSSNHNFLVEDGITIQQLKEKVKEQMGIETNLQRLIFCGRVLQDERRLSDYDVNGKVIHLVQRAPPSPESRHGSHSTSSAAQNGEGANGTQQPRRPGIAGLVRHDDPQITISPTTGRIDFIRLMITEIRTSLASLHTEDDDEEYSAAPASGEPSVENMETDSTPSVTQEENEPTVDENTEAAPDSATPDSAVPDSAAPESGAPDSAAPDSAAPDSGARAHYVRRRSYRAIRAMRSPRYSRPRELGQLMEELNALEEQFAPHRAHYTRLLMAAVYPEPPVYTEEERQNAQHVVDVVSDIMHSFAHAYHAVSDINFQVGQRSPRLTAEATVTRHPMPVQGHINMMNPTIRRQNGTAPTAGNGVTVAQTAAATTATATRATVTTAATTATVTSDTTTTSSSAPMAQAPATLASAAPTPAAPAAPAAPGSAAPAVGTLIAEHARAVQAGRNSTQPTVNINIQPDPITYQVEIETRVPIAFALENALLNGLAQGAVAPLAPTAPAAPAAPGAPAAPAAAPVHPAPDPSSQSSQPAQPNNQAGQQGQTNRRQMLFDIENLIRGLGQAGGLGGVEVVMSMEEIGNGQIVEQVPITNQISRPMFQAPPTLQQIGSMQHNGGGNTPYVLGADIFLGPLPWGGAPSAELLQNIVTSVIRQGLLPGGEAVALQVAQALPVSNGIDPNTGFQTATYRHGNMHFRRDTTTTRQSVGLNNFIYDRFLLCISPHARRRLIRRREQQQNQAAATARARADRAAAQNIEMLRERNPNITQSHIQTMTELFTSDPTRASFTNAFFVAVARHLFLTEPMQGASGEPGPVPAEFEQLRQMLRIYLQDIIVRSGGIHSDNTFSTVARFMLEEQEDFLGRVESITPLRPEYNFLASVRALISSRLPSIVACVMSDSVTEAFVARFYAVFSHLFTDLCTLVAYCCRDGIEGMRVLFRAFLEEKVRDFGGEAIQQLLITLGMENVGVVVNSLNAMTQGNPIQQFVIRHPPIPTLSDDPSMDMSPPSDAPLTPPPAFASSPAPAPSTEAAPPAPTAPTVPTAPTAPPASAAPPVPPAPPPAAPESSSPSDVTSTTDDDPAPSASNSPSRDVAANEPQTSRSVPTQTRVPRPSRADREAAPQRSSTDLQNNVGFVPPLVLIQHWGEEWVPVFTRDQHAQAQAPPAEPCSDAYLSGMPSRKRRCVRQSRPPQTLDNFVNESVREASERPAVDTGEVRSAFREHVRSMTRSRASSSDEFDPLRYTSAARFLNAADAKKEPPKKKTEDNA